MFKTEDRILALLNWIHIILLVSSVYLALTGVIREASVSYLAQAPASAAVSTSGTEQAAEPADASDGGVSEGGLAAVRALNTLADPFGAVWLLIPLILSYLLLRKTDSLPVFLLSSAATAAALFFLTRNPLTVLLSLGIFYVRGNTRVKKAKILADLPAIADLRGETVKLELWDIPTILDSPSMKHLIVHILMYLAVLLKGDLTYLKAIFGVMAADAFVITALLSFGNMKAFLIKMRGIANIPFRTMKQIQRVILGILLAGLVLCVMPSVLYGREPLTALRNLKFNGFDTAAPAEVMPEPQTMDQFGQIMDFMTDEGGGELPVWVKTIFDLILYAFLAALVWLLLRQAVRAFRGVMESYRAGGETDEIEFLSPADADEAVRLGTRLSRSDARTPAGKIRKAYRKMIRRKYRGMFGGHETPTEIELTAGLMERREKLHTLYEKARYGSLGCTDADFRQFKDELEKL